VNIELVGDTRLRRTTTTGIFEIGVAVEGFTIFIVKPGDKHETEGDSKCKTKIHNLCFQGAQLSAWYLLGTL
jgi:hypothetical protein